MQRCARCHCGGLRVTVSGDPEWVNLCHCTACQRRTGAVVHAGAYFAAGRVSIEGESRVYDRGADSGYRIAFHFCPTCGSNVFWKASRFSDYWGVAVGAFADRDFPPPAFSVWQESMHRWIELPAAIQQFEQGRVGPPLGITGRHQTLPG